MSFTLRTSCRDDIEPNSGLGDRGSDGGCSRGRCGAARFAPIFFFFLVLVGRNYSDYSDITR